MVRAPCCEKMGLKRGPWTAEEDEILVFHITRHGHGNWRALPKQAGLLRCGKSCRLRWINYLRPDIKRGNFTLQEEETIIKLHEELGNRWSAIAAKLPGRTDNEIKNVWHTNLKKRLVKSTDYSNSLKPNSEKQTKRNRRSITKQTDPPETIFQSITKSTEPDLQSSPESCTSTEHINYQVDDEFFDEIPEIDESFWSEPLVEEEETTSGYPHAGHVMGGEGEDDMGFWLRVLMEAGSSSSAQLPTFESTFSFFN